MYNIHVFFQSKALNHFSENQIHYTHSKEGKKMERRVGTVSRGIRCPIIREGDNLVDIAVTSVMEAAETVTE